MSIVLAEPCLEGAVRSAPPAPACTRSIQRWVLIATVLGSSMAFIDGTVVNVALPALQTNLKATIGQVQWVVEAYSLLLSSLVLIGGSLGDRYGRRRIFTIGTAIFAAASAWAGLASGIHSLIAARALQGAGAALLIPGSLALISNSFPEQSRGRAIGTWSAFSAITAAIGPVLGGWLVDHISWRAVFFINVPLALLVLIVSLRRVPESATRTEGRLDLLGALLVTIGLGSLVFGLIESSRLGMTHGIILTAVVVAALSLLIFLWMEARASAPMMPLELFRSRTFTGANLLTLFLYGALGGTLFFLPLYLIQVQRYSPTQAGGALLPFVLIIFLLSRWAGGLVQRFGAKLPLVVGPVIASAGFASFALPGIGGNYWTTFFPATLLLGTGMAVSVAPLTTAVMNSVSPDRAGVASGINNAVSRAAGLLAIAVFGIVMLHTFGQSLDSHLASLKLPATEHQSIDQQHDRLATMVIPASLSIEQQATVWNAMAFAFRHGFRVLMLISALLALAGALTSWLLVDGRKSGTS